MKRSFSVGLTVFGIGAGAVVVTAVAASLHAAITSGNDYHAFWIDYWAEFVNTLLTVVVLSLVIGAGVQVFTQRRTSAETVAQQAARRAATSELILSLIEPVHAAAYGYRLIDNGQSDDPAEWMRIVLDDLARFTHDALGVYLTGDPENPDGMTRVLTQFQHGSDVYRRGRAQRVLAVRTVQRELELLHLTDLEDDVHASVSRLRMRGFHFLLAAATTDEQLAASVGTRRTDNLRVSDLLDAPSDGALLGSELPDLDVTAWLEGTRAARHALTVERDELVSWITDALTLIQREHRRTRANPS